MLDTDKNKNNTGNAKKSFLIIAACVLVAALIVCAVMIVNLQGRSGSAAAVNQNGSAVKGVSVEGIDVSGMKKEEALSATKSAAGDFLKKIEIPVSVNGEVTKFTAEELGLETDYEDVVNEAIAYDKGSKDFKLKVKADKGKITTALQKLKEKVDTAPVDASAEFMPWGYLADGTAYEQDQSKMIKACASGKKWDRPDLVRIPDDQMPNKYRYLYWKNSKYIKDYIPADASVARFLYKDEVKGQTLNTDTLAESIVSAVEKGDFGTITAEVETAEPAVKVADLKANTQLVASWTSCYSLHYGYARNWNVAKLSGIINGQILQPGKEWSINKTAGDRTVKGGWKKAPGIENGGYTDQPGGGVCQISSTLYNASIRAGLKITDAEHHSIKSNYIPIGLDATISSGGPDLKIKNTSDTPYYIVSYVNPKDKNVTVEIYGKTVVDPEHGEVIIDYTSKSLGKFGSPKTKYIFNTKVAPDDHVLKPGEHYRYAENRSGERAQIYKIMKSLDGKQLTKEDAGTYKCNPINGIIYVNGTKEEENQPSPPPSDSPTDSTPPSSSPPAESPPAAS
jgi:hypothetical protein